MGDWHYIGHYGQLGPLTRDQINELIDAEVISHDTYVWRVGMAEWVVASRTDELGPYFSSRAPSFNPPPPPTPTLPPGARSRLQSRSSFDTPVFAGYPNQLATIKSDKNRTVAGVLQLLIPGVGRMYMGYGAYGVLQLVFAIFFCGIGWLWSIVDGIYILSGGVKYDGYGRRLGL